MATKRTKTRLPNAALTPNWDEKIGHGQSLVRADRRAAEAATDSTGNGGKVAAKGAAGTRSAVDGGVKPA